MDLVYGEDARESGEGEEAMEEAAVQHTGAQQQACSLSNPPSRALVPL